MISAGFKPEQCGANTACQQTFKRVQDYCATQGADQASCLANHVENVPRSYFAQDSVWTGANISADDHKLMLEAQTSTTWNGQPLGGAAPAATQPAQQQPAAQPVAQPAQQPPPPPPVDESLYPTNRYLFFSGGLGLNVAGTFKYDQKLNDQQDQKLDLFTGTLAVRGGFPITPRVNINAMFGYHGYDLGDIRTSDSLVDEKMGMMHQIDAGLGILIAPHQNVMFGADVYYARAWSSQMYRGIEGVCTSDDGVSCTSNNTFKGNGVGFNVNLAWMAGNWENVSVGPYLSFSGAKLWDQETDTVAGTNTTRPFIGSIYLGLIVAAWGAGKKSEGSSSTQQPAANANVSVGTNQ